MHHIRTFTVFAFVLALAACGAKKGGADDHGHDHDQEHGNALEAMAGGDPIPAQDFELVFPWMGKQSVMCIGDSFERQIAFADFSDHEDNPALIGSASTKADGTGTGAFTVPAAKLRTGDDSRDEKLLGGAWLDAETHPDITFKITALMKEAPTVWHVKGTWTMRGVTKDVAFYANVRWIDKMPYFSDDGAVRIKGGFDINLKEFGMDNGYVGSPAVAEVWNVEVVLLGAPKKG